MSENENKLNQAMKTVEAVTEVSSTVKWVAIFGTVVVIAVGGLWAFNKLTDVVGFISDVGDQVIEAGVEGTTETIEQAGENAAEIREATGNAVETATEGVDLEATGEAANETIDRGLGWIQQRRDQFDAAIDGDPDTSVNNVEAPNQEQE